jgi:hypothetical protein
VHVVAPHELSNIFVNIIYMLDCGNIERDAQHRQIRPEEAY